MIYVTGHCYNLIKKKNQTENRQCRVWTFLKEVYYAHQVCIYLIKNIENINFR